MNYLEKFKRKTIMNLFVCDYDSPYWKESCEILDSLDFETSIPLSKGHYKGLSIQVLLDTNLEDSKKFVMEILEKFPEKPLCVLSDVRVIMKSNPIGRYFDNDLVGPGRYFDFLLSSGKRGLFVYDGC